MHYGYIYIYTYASCVHVLSLIVPTTIGSHWIFARDDTQPTWRMTANGNYHNYWHFLFSQRLWHAKFHSRAAIIQQTEAITHFIFMCEFLHSASVISLYEIHYLYINYIKCGACFLVLRPCGRRSCHWQPHVLVVRLFVLFVCWFGK